MCRFIAYLGKPLLLHDVLYKPKNSLIQQSIHAKEMVDEPLNGDGFGIGWYMHHIDSTPALFRSIQPAWNDVNLKYLAKKIMSTCFFAHVRAASAGNVEIDNCHPFHYRDYLFMHNGDIGDFIKIKRYLRREMTDDIYEWVKGGTDSEHFFGLFLDELIKQKMAFTPENVALLLPETIKKIEWVKTAHHLTSPSYINAVITNGLFMVAIRYVSSPDLTPSSLHYAVGSAYEHRDNGFHIEPPLDNQNDVVFITSERLNTYAGEWQTVPKNSLLIVDESHQIDIQKINL